MLAAICFFILERYGLWVISLSKVSSIADLYKVCVKSLTIYERALNHLSFSQWDSAEPWGLLGMQVCEGRHWDWAEE